jgi:hypothetical protein
MFWLVFNIPGGSCVVSLPADDLTTARMKAQSREARRCRIQRGPSARREDRSEYPEDDGRSLPILEGRRAASEAVKKRPALCASRLS